MRFPPTRKWLLAALLGLAACLATARAQRTATPGPVVVSTSFRPTAPVVRDLLTADEESASLRIEFVLRLRHYPELQRRVAAGERIPRPEMAARFLPDAAAPQAVSRWLISQGLTPDTAPAGQSHTVVAASGTPAQWRRALGTRFARVRFRGEEYTAAVAAPSLPEAIAALVHNVHGLQPYLRARLNTAPRDTFSPPYLVADILRAYDIAASGLTGAGEQIGIIIDRPPLTTDLTRYWSDNHVPQNLGNITFVNVLGTVPPKPVGEESIDTEWSSGIASAAQVVVYFCTDFLQVDSCYGAILDDLQSGVRPNLHQISMSYGYAEETDETPDDIASVHEMFTAISAYGVSLFAASGDDGAFGEGGGQVEVLYPASDPLVTSVGGTILTLDKTTGLPAEEIAWSPTEGNGDYSSGGGISQVFARPYWQKGASVPDGAARLVPDVALFSNPHVGGYIILNGKPASFGGTSLATPCWAAMCALANQARANQGLPPLGVMSRYLYPLLGTSDFRDITVGNNGVYAAGPGYDLVTGLGVPDFSALVPALLAPPPPPPPAVTSPGAAVATAYETFSYQISASNGPASFSADGLPNGLSLDPVSGLITGMPTIAGTDAVTLGATNASGTGTAVLTITVSPAEPPVARLRAVVPQAVYDAGQLGVYAVRLSHPAATDLIVRYTLSGNAVNGVDYNYLHGKIRFKAGELGRQILVFPTGTEHGHGERHLRLTLAEGSGYTVGTLHPVTVTISTK